MSVKIKAEARKDSTKSEIKQLRDKGKIPGVVNGKKVGTSPIAIDQKQLLDLLRHHPHAIIEMELPDGMKQPVMVHEVQRDKLSREVLHIDFHQINMNEPVRTSVTLDFIGEAAGTKEGGIMQIQHHELEIRCLPEQIPDSIPVDISHLKLGENLIASDLKVPAGIEVKTDPFEVIIPVLTPQNDVKEDEEDSPAEEPAAVEHAPETNS
jgi:large subunit ribosomal protein L25